MNLRSAARLNNGVTIPYLGLGVYQSPPGSVTYQAVRAALETGYRHIDTAAVYENERDVGKAVRESGVPREEIFVTTKLWSSDQGYDSALRAFDASLDRLGFEKIDLYLIHWPLPEKRRESWKALRAIAASGRARAIGVSNYTIRHLEELLGETSIAPSVNQVELNPFLRQQALQDFCRKHAIQLEAYSPLAQAERLGDPRLGQVAARHGKTPAQAMIRWALQLGIVAIPKSVRAERIRENSEVFDFELSERDMAELSGLDEGFRTCWDPTDLP
jgi:diketogulonate reductase-like aldo/keto reductase